MRPSNQKGASGDVAWCVSCMCKLIDRKAVGKERGEWLASDWLRCNCGGSRPSFLFSLSKYAVLTSPTVFLCSDHGFGILLIAAESIRPLLIRA